MSRELLLIDLSSIAYPIWHMAQGPNADPNKASTDIVARVRALSSNQPHAAICCDSGRSFRHDLLETYKANRPEQDGRLKHQIQLACEALAEDGFPLWSVKGFEADDVIASAAMRALESDAETVVTIVTADTDLMQLVGPRVRIKSVKDGSLIDAAGVQAKFGVTPAQMLDFLCLVGDASDNVKGAQGIGEKKAADLLQRFGTLDNLYEQMRTARTSTNITPALATSLAEFSDVRSSVKALITLRTDVDLPFDEIMAEREVKQAPMATAEEPREPLALVPHDGKPAQQPEVLAAPVEWERGLDPRSLRDAQFLAEDMFKSRMFSAYGTPQAVLSTVMIGRELGLPAMAALRSVHVIDGKHSLSASIMVALVLKSGLAEYFDPVDVSPTSVTYETKRKGARAPMKLTHTIEMARQAWSKTQDAWDKSGWGRNPTDMLVARCTARLARMIYPDLLAGLYTPEELAEVRMSENVA